MQLVAFGLNHDTAPVAVRERAAFAPDALEAALTDIRRTAGADEAAILSTCNRTEIYCRYTGNQPMAVNRWLSRHSGMGIAELAPSIYQHPDEQAVRHAFRVASGLDSMVLGEPQILGQMKYAFQRAAKIGATGKVLNRLFQQTFNVAKQVRTNTDVGANAVSVAYMGVNLAKRLFTHLSEQTALLIGAGETIELVARHLKQQQIQHILIANRSLDRAQMLAQAVDGEAIGLSALPERLHQADIVVSSTASTLPILGKGAVEAALKMRRHRPMLILDLAVPRDVEPGVSDLQDAYVYTIDDLRTVVDENRSLRIQAAQQAEQIIDLQVVKFMRWMRSLESVSTITSFRESLNTLKQAELDKALLKLEQGADPQTVLDRFARDFTNKIAHRPSQVIRQADIDGNQQLTQSVKKLFDL